MTDSKDTMAKNIRHYMDLNRVTATEVCNALGLKQNTFSDWVNGKTYPRIDKIEAMANYFGVSKSALVEDRRLDYIVPTNDELLLIECYRKSDYETQQVVKRLVSYTEELKKVIK